MRETIEDLEEQQAPKDDARWLRICNWIGCRNVLAANEYVTCDEHEEEH